MDVESEVEVLMFFLFLPLLREPSGRKEAPLAGPWEGGVWMFGLDGG